VTDRLERIAAAVNVDNGLAIQMARYSHEDVVWLVSELQTAESKLARIKAAAQDYMNFKTGLEQFGVALMEVLYG